MGSKERSVGWGGVSKPTILTGISAALNSRRRWVVLEFESGRPSARAVRGVSYGIRRMPATLDRRGMVGGERLVKV